MIRAIVRRLGIAKNTVKKALASHEPPRCERAAKGTIVDAVEPQIRRCWRTVKLITDSMRAKDTV